MNTSEMFVFCNHVHQFLLQNILMDQAILHDAAGCIQYMNTSEMFVFCNHVHQLLLQNILMDQAI